MYYSLLQVVLLSLTTLLVLSNAQRFMLDCSPPLIYDRPTTTCLDFTRMTRTPRTFSDASLECPPGFELVSVESQYKLELLHEQFIRRDSGPETPTEFWTSGQRAGPDQPYYWHYADNSSALVGEFKPFIVQPIPKEPYIGLYLGNQPRQGFLPLNSTGNNLKLGVICEATICPPPLCKDSSGCAEEDFTEGGCRVCKKCANERCKMVIEDNGHGNLCSKCDCPADRLCWGNATTISEPLLGEDGWSVQECDDQGQCPEPAVCQTSSNTCCLNTELKCDTSKPCGYNCVYMKSPGDLCPVCKCAEFNFPVIFKLTISNASAVNEDSLKDICSIIEFNTQSTPCAAIPNTCNIFKKDYYGLNDKEYRANVEFELRVTYDKIVSLVDQCKSIVPNIIARDAHKNLGTVKASIMFDRHFEPTVSQLNRSPCLQSRQPQSCLKGESYSIRYEFNPRDATCTPFEYDGCETDNINAFRSKYECERVCALDRCYLPVQPGPCRAAFQRWAYNIDTGKCQRFIFGGCDGNSNNFLTEEDCLGICEPVRCRMPVDEGSTACYGHSELRRWYYMNNDYVHECRESTYSGCLGNSNRFITKEQCQSSCMKELLITSTSNPVILRGNKTEVEPVTMVAEFTTAEKNSRPARDVTKNPVQPITGSGTDDVIPDLQFPEFLVAESETQGPWDAASTGRPDVKVTDESEIDDDDDDVTKKALTESPEKPTDSDKDHTMEPFTNDEDDEKTTMPDVDKKTKVPDIDDPDTRMPETEEPLKPTDLEVTDEPKEMTSETTRDDLTPVTHLPVDVSTGDVTDDITGTQENGRTTTKMTTTPVTTIPPLMNPTKRFKANDKFCTCTLSGDPILVTYDDYRAAVEGLGSYLISQQRPSNSDPNKTFKLIVELIQADPEFPSILTTGKVVFHIFGDMELTFTENTITMYRPTGQSEVSLPYQDSNLWIRGHPGKLVWLTVTNNMSLVVDRTDRDNVQVTLAVPRQILLPGQVDGFCRDCNGYSDNDCHLVQPSVDSGTNEIPGGNGEIIDVCRAEDKYIRMSDHYRIKN